MLTPEKIQELDAKYNLAPAKKSVDTSRLREAWKKTSPGAYQAPVIPVEDRIPARFERLKENVGEALAKRTETFGEAETAMKEGKQGKLETLFQQFGQGVGLGVQTAMETARAVPILGDVLDTIAKVGVEGAKKVMETNPDFKADIEQAVQAYQNLPDETKRNLGAVGNIVDAITIGVGGKVAKETGKGVVEATAKGITRVGEALPELPRMTEFKDKIKGYADEKQRESIKQDVAGLLSTKGLSKKVQEAKAQNVNFDEVLSDPAIFKGLKVENKRIVPDESIAELQGRVDKVMEAKTTMLPVLDRVVPEVPKEQLRERAYAELKGKYTPADETSLKKAIDSQIDALPDTLKVSDIDKLRAQARASARDAKGQMKSQNEYAAIEKAAMGTVFDITDNLPVSGAKDYKALNDYVKGMIKTMEFLDKNVRGQSVAGGRVGSYTARLLGGLAGSQAGPLGIILGSEAGRVISDILVNNQLGDSIKMQLIRNITDDPEIIKKAEELLKEVQDINIPLLKEGGEFRTETRGGKTINLPSKTESTIEAEERKRLAQ